MIVYYPVRAGIKAIDMQTITKTKFITKIIGLNVSAVVLLLVLAVIPASAAAGDAVCGLNIDPANPAGNPDPASIAGSGWVRLEYKDCSTNDPVSVASVDQYRAMLQGYHSRGIKTLLILDYLTYPNAATNVTGFAQRSGQIAQQLGDVVDAYEVWNEEDHPRHYPLTPGKYASMLTQVSAAVKSKDPTATIVLGGLASGDVGYLNQVKTNLGGSLAGTVGAVGVHPYGQMVNGFPTGGFGELKALLLLYRDAAGGLPIWITEMGVGTTDQQQQAEYIQRMFNQLRSDVQLSGVVPMVTWFAWSDGMVNPFGIVDSSSNPKAAYGPYFANACGVSVPGTTANLPAVSPVGGDSCGGGDGGQALVPDEGWIHPGIDIKPNQADASSNFVYSTHAGFVTYAGPAPPSVYEKGWMVQIESDLNRDNVPDIITRYDHLLPNTIMINDVRYRRLSYTPEFFMSLPSQYGLEKLPYGYGPYVARNQLLAVVGDSGSLGRRHLQYEIVTNRYQNLYAAGLNTYNCNDNPYIEQCVIDAARPGFFFPVNRQKPSQTRAPVFINPGFVTPAPAAPPIIIRPTQPPQPVPTQPIPPQPVPGTCDALSFDANVRADGTWYISITCPACTGTWGDLSTDVVVTTGGNFHGNYHWGPNNLGVGSNLIYPCSTCSDIGDQLPAASTATQVCFNIITTSNSAGNQCGGGAGANICKTYTR